MAFWSFVSWVYFQCKDYVNSGSDKNFPKFSLQIKEIINLLEDSINSFWRYSTILIDIQDLKYSDLNIVDLMFYLDYKWYINIRSIMYGNSMVFFINIQEKLINIIKRNTEAKKIWMGADQLIKFWEELYYNKDSKIIIFNWKYLQLKETWYEKFIQILLDNVGEICWPEKFKQAFPSIKAIELLDSMNDKYNYIKKVNNKYNFLFKYIILYEGQWYQIKKMYP